MATTAVTLNLFQGDDHRIQFTFYDQDNNIINLTNGTVKFAIKKNLSDEDRNAIYLNEDVNKNNPTAGIATDVISDDVSRNWPLGIWKWQVRFIDNTPEVASAKVGTVIIEENLFDHE